MTADTAALAIGQNEAELLGRIALIRADLLQAQRDWGSMPHRDRYHWWRAESGWIPYRMVTQAGAQAAERQRFSRTIRGLVERGIVETEYSGRAKQIRLSPPQRKGKR